MVMDMKEKSPREPWRGIPQLESFQFIFRLEPGVWQQPLSSEALAQRSHGPVRSDSAPIGSVPPAQPLREVGNERLGSIT